MCNDQFSDEKGEGSFCTFEPEKETRYMVKCPYCPKKTSFFETTGHEHPWDIEDSSDKFFHFFPRVGSLYHNKTGILQFSYCGQYGCKWDECCDSDGDCREECQCACTVCTTFYCLYCPQNHVLPIYHKDGNPVYISDRCNIKNCEHCSDQSTCSMCYGTICDVCSGCECKKSKEYRQQSKKGIIRQLVQMIDVEKDNSS